MKSQAMILAPVIIREKHEKVHWDTKCRSRSHEGQCDVEGVLCKLDGIAVAWSRSG